MRTRAVVACVAVSFALASCGQVLEPAAAVVNGRRIPMEEITSGLEDFASSAEYRRLTAQGDEGRFRREFEQGLLSQLIRRAVLQPKADALGVEIPSRDVQERIEQIKAGYPSEKAFAQALEEQGLGVEQMRELVRDRLLEERLRREVTADVAPSEAEARAFYQDNIERFRRTRASHILVEDEVLAQRIADQLHGASPDALEDVFARLARRHSTDERSARDGGDLGFYTAGELGAPEFEQAADELAIGEVSDAVRTDFGWHVILVTDRSTQPFEEVESQIVEQLSGAAADDAWQRWLIDAYEDADIEVNPRYGRLDVKSQRVVDPRPGAVPGGAPPAEEQTPPPTLPGG